MDVENIEGELPETQKTNETEATGVGGYKIANGYVFDEYIPALQGERARRKYREMIDHPTLGALLSAVEMLLRAVDFKFEANTEDIDNYYVEFAEMQLETMDQSWEHTLTEILTFLPFGFSIMEMVFKRMDDGLFTTAKLAPRSQETIWQFDVDKHGDIKGVIQQPPYGGDQVYMPYNKLLHFKTKMERGNPEGRSIFRSAYTSYHYEKSLTTIEAIAVERELNGMPIIKIPTAAFKDSSVLSKYVQMARDMKFNEQGGAVIPSTPYYDENGNPTNTPQYEVELISSTGTRNIDTNEIIYRHKQDMLRTVLADFLMLGANDRGSFALSKSKTALFLRSVESYLSIITSELNDKWMTTLWNMNGFPLDKKPKMKAGDIAPVDLQELGQFIRDTGLLTVMDDETEDYIREVAGMPKRGQTIGETM